MTTKAMSNPQAAGRRMKKGGAQILRFRTNVRSYNYKEGIAIRCIDAGDFHLKAGNAIAAVSMYRRALMLFPGHRVARTNLGVALSLVGRPDAAASVLRGVLRDFPQDAAASCALATAYICQERFAEAARSAAAALGKDRFMADAWKNLAIALRGCGNVPGAKLAILESAKLAPSRGDIWGEMGSLLIEAGEKQLAMQCLKRARLLGWGDPAVERLIAAGESEPA